MNGTSWKERYIVSANPPGSAADTTSGERCSAVRERTLLTAAAMAASATHWLTQKASLVHIRPSR